MERQQQAQQQQHQQQHQQQQQQHQQQHSAEDEIPGSAEEMLTGNGSTVLLYHCLPTVLHRFVVDC